MIKFPSTVSKAIIIFLLLLVSFSVFAKSDSLTNRKEYKNTISFTGSNYYFKGYIQDYIGGLFIWQDNQAGICYERKISKHFKLKIGYNQWLTKSWYHKNGWDDFYLVNNNFKVGNTTSYDKYKNIDVSAYYVLNCSKRQRVSVGVGGTSTWGWNSIIDSMNSYMGYGNPEIYQHVAVKYYYGFISSLSYDYLCFKNRVSLGADLRYRKYFNFYLNTWEYGVHFGFNF